MARLRSALAVSAAALGVHLFLPAAAYAQQPSAIVRGELPEDLRSAIVTAVGESRNPPASRLEARRRAQEAGEDAIAVLESRGYYDHRVEPDVTDEEPSQAIVTISPGERFTIAVPLITWDGDAPPPEVQSAAETAMDLPEGAPGEAARILGAQGRIVAAVRSRGYADVQSLQRSDQFIVDHASQSVIPEFIIDAGSVVRLNGIDLRTEGRTNLAWVEALAPWEEGDVYDPEDVAELERRLLDAGVYEQVTVSLAPATEEEGGNRPVLVSLADQPRAILELGAGYSTTEGPGLDGRYIRYNRFGRADTLVFQFRLAQIESLLDAELSLPHWRRPQQTLALGAAAFNSQTDAYDEFGAGVRADVTRRYGANSTRTLGISADVARIDELVPAPRTRNFATISVLGALAWDRSNDPLNPTTGWRFDGRLEPTLSAGGGASAYVRAQAQTTAYLPLTDGARTVIAGRLMLGSVLGAALGDIPASQRFYAGGGGSVRGYEYQGVGPRLINDVPVGGLSVFEASFEVRQQFTERWGGVAFVDFGGLSQSETPDFSSTATGIGVGVRYDLGFGPIRADIAVPLSRRDGAPAYQIYISIGQSF